MNLPTSVATPPAVNLPNGNTSVDAQTGITPNQYALAPGESAAAYNTRIAGLRTSSGMATPSTDAGGAPTDSQSAEDQVAQSLGYKSYADAVGSLTAPPSQSETDLYNSAYQAAGLDSLTNTITARKNDLADAQNKINDNPWLDESSRIGRNQTVQNLAQADISNLQSEYNAKLQEVHDLVTRETADGTASTTANKAKLAALEAQAKQLAADAATKAKTEATPPKTVKGADGTTYQWNAGTGKFDPILPGKTPNGTPGKPTADAISKITSTIQSIITQGQSEGQKDSFISPNDWSDALAEWTSAGYSTADFVKQFKGYANTKDPTNHYEGLN